MSPAIRRRWRLSALVALISVMPGACNTHPWIAGKGLTPWIAPDTRAVTYFQSVENSESVWRDTNGREFWLNEIQDEIEQSIMNTGMVEGWPKSSFRTSAYTLRVPPFRYTLVSINPTVVLMTPFEFGSAEGRALSAIIAPIGERSCLGSGHLVNGIECDTDAVYAPGMQWFSPDLKVTPQPIAWRSNRAEIPLKNGEVLALTHDDEMARTVRKRTGG